MRYLIFTFFLVFISQNIVYSQNSGYVTGEYIIQLKKGYTIESLQSVRNLPDQLSLRYLSKPLDVLLYTYDINQYSISEIESQLSKNPAIESFGKNQFVQLRNTPNDKHFDKQWNLVKIGIEEAWNVTTGGQTILGDEIVVAILDSGFNPNLNDLLNNVHRNNFEVLGDQNLDGCPGICGVDDDNDGLIDEDFNGRTPDHPLYDSRYAADDDENGYIDDILGLNLKTRTDEHPTTNHGTAVAGIIGATGNNSYGIAGINWNIKMLLMSEVIQVSNIIEAYQYIYEKRKLYNETNGGKGSYIVVSNFSSGIDNEFGEDFPFWCGMYDLMGSVGILSVGATTNKDSNVDEVGDMPTTCSSPYLIAVTNTTMSDTRAIAGYGKENIDLGAPGNQSITLGLGQLDEVGEFSGTSASAPHVAGAIALIHSIPCENFASYFKENPSRVDEIKNYLLQSVDPVSDLEGITVSGGRLNVFNMMLELQDFCETSSGDLEILNVYPNPSYTEDIIIEYQSPSDGFDYTFYLYDMVGRLIMKEQFSPPIYGEKALTITPPVLSSGSYILLIRNEEDIVARKHIILPHSR